MDAGNYDPQAVGTEDPHPRKLPLLATNLLLQVAARLADLAEAGGNNDDPPRPGLAKRADQLGNRPDGVQMTARSGTFGRLWMFL